MKYIILLGLIVSIIAESCKDKDSKAPIITLEGDTIVSWPRDTAWKDPGFTAYDEEDGDITDKVVVSNIPNVSQDGDYFVTYNVKDNAGNQAEEKVRKVKVMIF